MANYYNVTGWIRTGFNYYNRPFNRDVLNQPPFTDSYFQAKGILVNRDDMQSIKYIELQGSVKDLTGEQVNVPSQTGSQGPGGPWYALEEVDYIRLVRTGYPGDPDYVDINSNPLDPWNAGGGGKRLFVAYYFVTGLTPTGRNTTIVHLQLDEWLSLGGADELEIECGYKVRGHITEAEDAATYNLSAENITTLEPLETKSHQIISVPGATVEAEEFLVSSIDLTQYSQSMSVDAFVAQAASGQSVAFPSLRSVTDGGWIQLEEPTIPGQPGTTNTYILYGYRAFDQTNQLVQHNLSILYSAGQLELQDSYRIPSYMVEVVKDGGRYTSVKNKTFSIKPAVTKSMSYPRKCDYMFGQEILYSLTTGDMNAQPFFNLADDTVVLWAVATPTGSPYARFSNIKNHPYLYDQAVQGMTWVKKAVVLQGASGSMWNQLNNNFAQQTLNRQVAQAEAYNEYTERKYKFAQAQTIENFAYAGIQSGMSMLSAENYLTGGEVTLAASKAVTDLRYQEMNMIEDRRYEKTQQDFKAQSLEQAQNQINAQMAIQNFKAPLVSFVPDLSRQVFANNGFGVYVVNVTAHDRERLKNYFLRYGYSGQYKPLTWDNINVKSRVNYIEAEGVTLRHKYYPMRMTVLASNLLRQGVFLWNERPSQDAFENNPDN